MNIFRLADDPYTAAMMQCDKHVVKMIVETAQILSTVYNRYGKEAHYKPTHAKHPSTLWAGDSTSNYRWLVSHGIGLCSEYTRRYHKRHKCQDIIEQLSEPPEGVPDDGYTTFPQCMPDQYKCDDPVVAYRSYYKGEKAYMAKWKYTETPQWWKE